MTAMKIGYIGLGLMGKAMARNLLKAGFPVIVHNRSREAVRELVREGAGEAFSPAEVARRVDIVFTNVPNSDTVEEVVLGADGILAGAHPGLIFIDNSTIKPGSARKVAAELAEVGVMALDAPVSGGQLGAINGTLTVMVGGDPDALETALPALNAFAKKVTYIGGSGCGQIAKCANQIMVAAQMVAMGELLLFAKKAGADPEKVTQAICAGAAQCWTLDTKPERIFNGELAPGFKAEMMSKDLTIVVETAREYGIPIPSAALDAQLYESMIQCGDGALDNSAVFRVIEKLAGIHLLEESK